MKAYKGFDKELKCREFRFAIGETYTHEGKIKACNSGFHACTNPVDILNYYDPVQSRFAEVEMSGDMDRDTDDSKIACSTITIQRELSLTEFISICADYIVNNVDKEINNSGNSSLASNSGNSSLASNSGNSSLASNSGNRSLASNSGDRSLASNSGNRSLASNSGYSSLASNSGDRSLASNSGYSSLASNSGDSSLASNSGDSSLASNSGNRSLASNNGYRSLASNSGDSSLASNNGNRSLASNSGYRSLASNSGYSSLASVTGQNSIAISTGRFGQAKGALGCWIVISERDEDWNILTVKSVKVDGKKIKADTYYKVENGKVVKA